MSLRVNRMSFVPFLRSIRRVAALTVASTFVFAFSILGVVESTRGQDARFAVDQELVDNSVKFEVEPDAWRGSFSVAVDVAVLAPGSEVGNGDQLGMIFNVSSGWHDGLRLIYDWRDGRFSFQLGKSGGASTARSARGKAAGPRRILVVAYDKETRVGTLYVDGAKEAETRFDGVVEPGDGRINVGFGGFGVGSNRMKVGAVQIWRRALAEPEIAALTATRSAEEIALSNALDSAFSNVGTTRLVESIDDLKLALDEDLTPSARETVSDVVVAFLAKKFKSAGAAVEEIDEFERYADLIFGATEVVMSSEPSAEPTAAELARFGESAERLQTLFTQASERVAEARKPQETTGRGGANSLLRGGTSARANVAKAREAAERYSSIARSAQRSLDALRAKFKKESATFAKLNKYEALVDAARRMERDAMSMYADAARERRDRTAATIYASPTGSDAGDGSESSPFGSLAAAFEEAARLRAEGEKRRIVVSMAPGEYYATRAAKLDGVENVLVKATTPGEVKITGARRISKFSSATAASLGNASVAALVERIPSGARDKVFVADLLASGVKDLGRLANRGYGASDRLKPTPTLYLNGEAQTLARWPNLGEEPLKFGEKAEVEGAPEKSSSFRYDFDRVDGWKLTGDPTVDDVWAFGLYQWEWAANLRRVLAIDRDAKTITFDYENGSGRFTYYFVNVLEELDAPGEYYVDQGSGTLLFYPPKGLESAEALANAKVEYDEFSERFVELENATDTIIRDVTFSGGRASAVLMKNCRRCYVDNCVVEQMGGDAVKITNGTFCGVLNSRLRCLGARGVVISGGDRDKLTPCYHIMTNNYVSDFSRIDRVYAPALAADGCGIIATNNLICNSPHHAFRTDGNDIYIARNEIHSVVLEYSDQAGLDVYCDPGFRGIVIERNLWRHIGSSFALCGQAGVRLDDSISGVVMKENVFYRSSGGMFGGIQIHGGKDNYAEKNVFVNCKQALSFSPWRNDRYAQFVTERFPKNADNDLYRSRYPFFDEILEHIDRNYVVDNKAINCGVFQRNGDGLEVFVGNLQWESTPDLAKLGVKDPAKLALSADDAFLTERKALRAWLEELAGFSLKDVGLKTNWGDAGEDVSPLYSVEKPAE